MWFRYRKNIPNTPYGSTSFWQRSIKRLLSDAPLPSCDPPAVQFSRSPLATAAASWISDSPKFEELLAILAPRHDFSLSDSNGRSAIALALRSPDTNGGRRAFSLLQCHPEMDAALRACHPLDGTLAHLAAKSERPDFLAAISSMADLDARDDNGRTPLMAAAGSAHDTLNHERIIGNDGACMRVLLENGCDARAVDRDGSDALMLLMESLDSPQALKNIDLNATVSLLIEKSNPWARDFLGESALDKAKLRNMSEVVLALQNAQARSPLAAHAEEPAPRLPACRPGKLQELLFQAIEQDDVLLASQRLSQGADPRKPSPDFEHLDRPSLRTPLMAAAEMFSPQMIALLAPLSNLVDVNADGETALIIFLDRAPRLFSPKFLDALPGLYSPAVARVASHAGHTPLRRARTDAASWPQLLALLGPDSDWMALDSAGNNILGRPEGCRSRSASPDDDMERWNAHPDQAWLALSVNHAGETLAHLAAARGAFWLLSAIAPHADFNLKNMAGSTPLLIAASDLRESWESVCLLASLSDCLAVDAHGCDALMLLFEGVAAEDDGLCEAVEALVGRVNLDARDFLGESTLDKAIERDFLRSVDIIRARMAIFEERDELANASPPSSASARPAARI